MYMKLTFATGNAHKAAMARLIDNRAEMQDDEYGKNTLVQPLDQLRVFLRETHAQVK